MFILAQRAGLHDPNLIARMAFFFFVMRLEPRDASNDLAIFGMMREALHDDDHGLVVAVAPDERDDRAHRVLDRQPVGLARAGVVAFQRSTTEAVVVLSVFLKPGTGSFEKRSRYASFKARRAFIAACAVSSTSRRYADEFLKSG